MLLALAKVPLWAAQWGGERPDVDGIDGPLGHDANPHGGDGQLRVGAGGGAENVGNNGAEG